MTSRRNLTRIPDTERSVSKMPRRFEREVCRRGSRLPSYGSAARR